MRSRWRFIFIALFFCFLFYGVSVYGDYDISSNYRKTEFNSSKWIQAYHNLTINENIGYIRSEWESSDMNYSNFLEVDENFGGSYIQVHNITYFTSYQSDRDVTNYLVYDGGLNNYLNWDIKFNFKFNATTLASYCDVLMFGTVGTGTRNEINLGENFTAIRFRKHEALPSKTIVLLYGDYNNVRWFKESIDAINFDVWYYGHYFRVGNNVTLNVFTNELMNNRLIHLSSVGDISNTIRYRYLYGCSTDDLGTSGYELNADIILDVGYLNGVIYTKNLLANTTENSIMLGINGTATTNTRIRVYTSSDNSTWVLQIDNNGLGNLFQYEEILYEYSTLYVRVNLTTTDTSLTPFLDELFYLHTYECVAGSETKPYVFIILFTIIGMLLGYAVDRT